MSARGALLLALCALARGAAAGGVSDWPYVGGEPGNARWSELADITPANVANLKLAWSYQHGDFYDPGDRRGPEDPSGTAFEGSPLLVDGRLVFATPYGRMIALDPENGRELWVFDPKVDRKKRYSNGYVTRGVAHWRDAKATGVCASRVLQATVDSRLIAIDSATGKPCAGFGENGTVDLHAGVERLEKPEFHKMTSPPVVVGDVIAVGASLVDMRPVQPSGDVRGYDARTGKLLWTFHVIPKAGEPGVETWPNESWKIGVGANPWAPLSADLERGLLFVPTSTASPDYYGGRRPGDNLYADSILALRATTGERVWSQQLIHHDLWDYDVASPPNLVRLNRAGHPFDAVAQLTKTGFVYVFERETGKPVFEIREKPVPASDVPGESASPTQPIPVAPPFLLDPPTLTENDVADFDPEHHAKCLALYRSLRNDGQFTPPSAQGSLQYPGTAGGGNWSGAALDPRRAILYAPLNTFAMIAQIDPKPVGPEGPNGLPALRMGRMGIFSIDARPCTKPPWGLLVAIDLNRGEVLWRAPLGIDRNGVRGLFNLGSPLATAGGLVLVGGTQDGRLYAYATADGRLVKSFDLPAGLHAGPITYRLREGGKQFLVIAAGGHYNFARLERTSKVGDYILAYTLP